MDNKIPTYQLIGGFGFIFEKFNRLQLVAIKGVFSFGGKLFDPLKETSVPFNSVPKQLRTEVIEALSTIIPKFN